MTLSFDQVLQVVALIGFIQRHCPEPQRAEAHLFVMDYMRKLIKQGDKVPFKQQFRDLIRKVNEAFPGVLEKGNVPSATSRNT